MGEGEVPGLQIAMVPFEPLPSQIGLTHTKIYRMNPITKERTLVDYVMISIADPSGVKVHFWEPDVAEKIAKDIQTHAWQARTGIEVVGKHQPIIGEPNGQRAEDGDGD